MEHTNSRPGTGNARSFIKGTLFFLAAALITGQFAPAQNAPSRKVAITMDDLPVAAQSDYEVEQTIFGKLLPALEARHIPLIGFMNEGKLMTDGRLDTRKAAFLKAWLKAGFDLGNHTRSHLSLNKVQAAEFEQDVLAGETVLRELVEAAGKKLRYFRYPYLHTGRSQAVKDELDAFLSEHGYTQAPVTIDNSEWIFALAYEKANSSGDTEMMKRTGDEYIDYMRKKFEWFELKSRELFGREIAQVLLIHANRLNAEYFGELCAMIKARGYVFVSLDAALKDEAYMVRETFTGRGGISWIDRWAIAAGKTKKFFAGEPSVPQYIMKYAGVDSE